MPQVLTPEALEDTLREANKMETPEKTAGVLQIAGALCDKILVLKEGFEQGQNAARAEKTN